MQIIPSDIFWCCFKSKNLVTLTLTWYFICPRSFLFPAKCLAYLPLFCESSHLLVKKLLRVIRPCPLVSYRAFCARSFWFSQGVLQLALFCALHCWREIPFSKLRQLKSSRLSQRCCSVALTSISVSIFPQSVVEGNNCFINCNF